MNTKVRKKYSQEFKRDAVKLVTEQGYRVSETSRNLDVNTGVLRRWIKECFPRQWPHDSRTGGNKKASGGE